MRLTRLAVIALALSQGAYLLAWSPTERVDRKPSGYAALHPAIAVGPDGVPRAVWEERLLQQALDKVMYARREGDTWTIPLNVSRDSGDIRFPALAMDGLGRAVVVWSEEGRARIKYVRQMDDTWSLPKLCFPYTGITPRLVSDGRGRLHLLYEDLASHGGIWYSYFLPVPDSWTTPTRVALGTGEVGWSSLAVDRFDHLHAVWMDWGTNGLDYALNDGTGWAAPTPLPDPAPDAQSCEPAVAADSSGRPFVFWQERWSGYWLYHSRQDDTAWTTPVKFCDVQGDLPSACGGPLGEVHVLWNTVGLLHAAVSDSGWSAIETLDAASSFESAVTQSGGDLHAIWRRGGSLFYSRQALSGVRDDHAGLRAGGDWLRTLVGTSHLAVHLDEPETADLLVLNAAGARVSHVNLGLLAAGTHIVRLPTSDTAAGVYFCRVRAGCKVLTTKMARTR